jgi:hypothetical protein
VFVPNRSSGRTVVVDVGAGEVAAELAVVKPGRRLELLAKDGFVFYNDLDGDQAGVIRFDGGAWRVGKSLKKYGGPASGQGILAPGGGSAKVDQPPTDVPGRQPDKPSTPIRPPATNPPAGGANPPGGGGQHPPPGPPHPPPTVVPVIRAVTWNPDPVVRGQPATFTAQVDNAQGATWAWSILGPGGNSLHDASSAATMTHTLPAGTPDNLQIRLRVRNGAGPAEVTRPFTTVPGGTPHVSLTCSTLQAGLHQPVTCTGKEPVSGTKGVWTWTVAGPNGTVGPEVLPAGQARTDRFDVGGSYRVTLMVKHDGAQNQASVDVDVQDACRFANTFRRTADLRRNAGVHGVEIMHVQATNCFKHDASQEPTTVTPGWLKASIPDMSWDGPDAGTGTFTINLETQGFPPRDGLVTNAFSFQMPNGATIAYDVEVNIPPRVTEVFPCEKRPDGTVRFVIKFTDAEPDQVTGRFTAGSFGMAMTKFTHGSDFFEAIVPASSLPNVSFWTATVKDSFGETHSGGGSRGSCW